jgi:transcriptional regulator with PAS, ATPase and Fis domain
MMAKIAFLAVKEEMILQAKKVTRKIDVDVEMKVVTSHNAVVEAMHSVQNGANVVIARGNHAALISKNTEIPIVEIVLTGQEIAKLIQEAKEKLQKPSPVIALVGFQNMLSSTKLLDEILDVTIKEYFVNYAEELEGAVEKAALDKVDFIIGGEIVNAHAEKLNIPTLFLKSREDSIREAFRIAEKVAHAIDVEKKNTAEFKTILDYSFDGIIKLNNNGKIVILNYLAEKILRKSSEELIGKHITEVIDTLDQSIIQRVLSEGKALYSTLLHKENLALVSNIAPIIIDNKIEGAMVSFQEFKKIEELEAEIRKELYAKGYVAKSSFKHIVGESSEINRLIETAKLYAKYDLPVLITGESGTGKKMFAQSIHNESLRKSSPYVAVNCSAMSPEQLEKKLYGYLESNYMHSSSIIKKGLFEVAHTGTIFLENISEMDLRGQANLLRVLNEGSIARFGDDRILPVNVRVMCSSNKNLMNLVKEGKFSEELYYTLCVLSLNLSPVRTRKEDVLALLDCFIDEYNNRYKKYVVLTEGAKSLVCSYPWQGNVRQLKSFCEKITILAPKKVLNDSFINEHLEPYSIIYDVNKYSSSDEGKKVVVYENPEAAKILELLEKHNGNRGEVAGELNISKTTLWRKLKKYKIENKFEL